MIFNILFMTLPAMSLIFAIIILARRNYLIHVFGPDVSPFLLMFGILFITYGTLRFVLSLGGFIDWMLLWVIGFLILGAIVAYVFYQLFKHPPQDN